MVFLIKTADKTIKKIAFNCILQVNLRCVQERGLRVPASVQLLKAMARLDNCEHAQCMSIAVPPMIYLSEVLNTSTIGTIENDQMTRTKAKGCICLFAEVLSL